MSVIYASPLTSANVNGAFVSRTVDTDMAGQLDNQNTTDATNTLTGALHTAGGIGVEKKAYLNQVFVPSLAGSFALVTSPSKEVSESAVTSTELGYVSGVTAPVQGQIDSKATDSSVVHITGNQSIAGVKTFTDDTNLDGDVVIGGDLTVNGTTTTVNSATLDVVDTNITVNKTGNDATSEGAGLTVDRTGTKGSFVYANALASRFEIGDLGSESEVINAAATQTMSGVKTLSASVFNGYMQLSETINSALTGSNANLNTPTPTIRLTNASLVSIETIDDYLAGKTVVISNNTGASIVLKNDSGSPAGLRIITGTGADLTLEDGASIIVSGDSNASRWKIVGGSGSGGTSGRSGVYTLATNDQTKSVVFSSTLSTTNYSVSICFENDVDTDSLLWMSYVVKNKSATGFDVIFNQPVNSNNYVLNWKADLYA